MDRDYYDDYPILPEKLEEIHELVKEHVRAVLVDVFTENAHLKAQNKKLRDDEYETKNQLRRLEAELKEADKGSVAIFI